MTDIKKLPSQITNRLKFTKCLLRIERTKKTTDVQGLGETLARTSGTLFKPWTFFYKIEDGTRSPTFTYIKKFKFFSLKFLKIFKVFF